MQTKRLLYEKMYDTKEKRQKHNRSYIQSNVQTIGETKMKSGTLETRLALFDILMKDIVSTDFRKWLINQGFFAAPASTKFHGSYEGGLFDHSFNVAISLLKLTTDLKLSWQRPESPLIVGMFHDLCKIDQYVFNFVTKTYMWNGRQTILGHGDKSVKLLLEHIDLTDEERICIANHMGAFVDKEQWPVYTESIHKYPNVLYTHIRIDFFLV